MLAGLLRASLSAFAGALGFALLLHAPRRSLLIGSLIGSLGYTLFWLLPRFGMPEALSMFAGAFVAAAAAQLAARRLRMISTIFTTIAILPLVPGIGLYRAMSALGQSDTGEGALIAVQSMTLILMIALGVAFGSALFGVRSKPVCQREAGGKEN